MRRFRSLNALLVIMLAGCSATTDSNGGSPDRDTGQRHADTDEDGVGSDDAPDGTAPPDTGGPDAPVADTAPDDGTGAPDAESDGNLHDTAGTDAGGRDAAEDTDPADTSDPPTSFCGDGLCDPDESSRNCPADCGWTDLPRGLTFVRSEPLFISGLSVAMPQPPAAIVTEYFDVFGATAVHTWEDGIPTQIDGWRAAGHPDFRFVSWVHADGTSRDGGAVIGGYPPNVPGRIGFQIGDEPRSMAALAEMEVGIAAVRSADPDALIIVNYSFHPEDLPEMLARTAELDVDVYSYDTYTYRSRGLIETANIFREAALAADRPYWCYLKSFYERPDDGIATISDMRWQAFAHMALGFTGYTWFIYQIAPPHSDGLTAMLYDGDADWGRPHTEAWARAAQVNLEIANTGRVVSQLTSTDIRYIAGLPLLRPVGVDDWSRGAGGDRFITSIVPQSGGLFTLDLLIGFFADDAGEQYVMLQNQAHENNEFPHGNTDSLTTHLEFDFAGSDAVDTSQLLSFVPATGATESVALSSLGGTRARLVLTLGPGEVLFFKYATGRPFATAE